MELQGKIKAIGETANVSEKFKKRDFVITTDADGKYPQHISLQCTQDKVALLDNMAIGQDVKCSINIRGREWTSPSGEVKYFNTIECWKLEIIGEQIKPTLAPTVDDLPF